MPCLDNGIEPSRRVCGNFRVLWVITAVFVLLPPVVAAQTWCGGHKIGWRDSEPEAFFSPKHEDGTAPVVEYPAWLIRDRWDALVFDAFDRAEPLDQTIVLRRQDVAGIRVCVQSPEASDIGKHLQPHANVEWWRFHIRRWTDVSWRGELRIAECRGEAPNGWVYVRAAEGDEIRPGAASAYSRRASHPHGAGRWLSSTILFQPEPSNPDALEPLVFEGILAHELGHVMGFSHVPGDLPWWIMQVPEARPWPKGESQHAQLAYRVGPNVRYPGLTPPSSLSNDATLRALELVARPDDYHLTGFFYLLKLIPAFDPAIQSYTATAPSDATNVAVTARVNELNATVTVNGAAVGRGAESDPIKLEVGENVFIEVVVTAQDGTTMLIYTAEVARDSEDGAPSAPSVPRNLTAVGGEGLVVLKWDAPENDGGAAITDYEYRIDRRDPWISIGSTNTTHTVTGLVNGATYIFQVRAVNRIGKSFVSNQVEATPEVMEDRIYYFPHLAVGTSWQTTITYINYSSEEVTCQTDFLSQDGSPLAISFEGLGAVDSRTDVLPSGGSIHDETNVDLSAPFAVGWARATCSGPVKASILFRHRNSEGVPTGEAGVNAATVPSTQFVTFAEQGEGKFGTGVAYANPSAKSAHVTFTAKNAAGRILASVDRTLLPGGHDAQGMSSLFGLTSFTGSLEVTSSVPIVSLSINIEADPVFSSLPLGDLDADAQGPTTYYFPHLAVGTSWQTTITYINYSSEEVTCQTDFLSQDGSRLAISFEGRGAVDSRTDVLPSRGSVHDETNVDLSAPFAVGWARATCSGPVKASILFRHRNSEGVPTGEAGVNAATVPSTRFVTFAEQGEGKFGTGVACANPSAKSAHVTFTAKNAAGRILASVDRTLLPGGHDAQGMSSLFGLTSFTGSLEVTSSVPIISLSINIEADPVFSSLPPGEIE